MFLLFGLAAFSLVLKLFCWHLDPTVSRDGSLYLHFIQSWYDTGHCPSESAEWRNFRTPPLMFFLVKSLMWSGLSAETIGVMLNIILGAFISFLGYGIAYEITQDIKISICSALLLAVNPSLNRWAIEVQRDTGYLFFAGAAVWMTAAGIRRQKWQLWLGAGIFAGCAVLTRAEAVEIFGIVLISFMIQWFGQYLSKKKCFFFATVFYGSLFAVIAVFSFLMQPGDRYWFNYKTYFLPKGIFQNVCNSFTADELNQ